MKDVDYLQKLKKDTRLQAIEWSQCQEDPYYWMTNWAFTLDVHDRETPVKPFPDKEYVKIIVEKFQKHNLLLIPKSRQMMLSWIMVALALWDTQFHKGRLTFFQSKKADDANDLVRRAKHIWDNEPKFLKVYYDNQKAMELRCNPQNQGNHVYNSMSFPDIYSEIRGIPEGGDVIRMHTASLIISDEMAFQPEAKAAFTAARPTISNNGKFIGISTAEDSTFFEELVFDQIETV
jgi:hypothetical protein